MPNKPALVLFSIWLCPCAKTQTASNITFSGYLEYTILIKYYFRWSFLGIRGKCYTWNASIYRKSQLARIESPLTSLAQLLTILLQKENLFVFSILSYYSGFLYSMNHDINDVVIKVKVQFADTIPTPPSLHTWGHCGHFRWQEARVALYIWC